MNKLYTRTGQARALLFALFMGLIAPLSMQSFAQSPCSAPVVRVATNGKSTNTNIYDDITLLMTNLLGTGTEGAWVMEAGGTFTENPDGTARFVGNVKQFGDYTTPRRMALDMLIGGRTFTPDAMGPYNQTGVDASGWSYYRTMTGTLTGLDALVGGKLNVAINSMHSFQVGVGANQLFSPEDQGANGAGGWFTWTIVTQPTNAALQFTNYIDGTTISDVAILLSGSPSVPCDPCTSPVVRTATNGKSTNTNIYDDITLLMTNLLGTGTEGAWVMEAGGTFTENPDGTARFVCNVKQFGDYTTPHRMALDMTLGGKTYTPNAMGAYNPTGVNTSGWYFYRTLTGTLTGLDALVGGKLNVAINSMHSFQVGIGANQLFSPEDQVANGAGGWFTWTVATQPTDAALQFTHYIDGTTLADVAILLSGTPSVSCDPCANDKTPPVLSSCPASLFKDVTGLSGTCWVMTWTAPTATDNCSNVTITSNYKSGDCFPTGITTVTYTAADTSGNKATCSFAVDIVKSISCSVLNNTISKACVNNVPVLSGTPLVNHEYLWLQSTTGCPISQNQAIVGATDASYTLPSRVSVTTYFIRYARPVGCTVWGPANGSNCLIVNANECAPTNCTVTGNTLTKTCVNNIPVINGTNLGNFEYVWLKSTTGCPTQSTQMIVGATGQNYTLPSRVTVTTYFVRCARPVGCTTWGPVNESNCISILPTDCLPINCNVTGNTLTKTCVNNIPVINGTNLAPGPCNQPRRLAVC